MARFNIALGIVILACGFLIYQLGFSFVLHQAGVPSPLATIFPEGSSLELIGTFFEFGGGILGIIGLIICISSVMSTQRRETMREISRLESVLARPRYEDARPRYEEPATPVRRCKFCGNEVDEGAVFCSVCNRSQR